METFCLHLRYRVPRTPYPVCYRVPRTEGNSMDGSKADEGIAKKKVFD